MTSRAPVCVSQYAVAMLTFVVIDSLQTDTEQRKYRLVRSIFMAALRSRRGHYIFVLFMVDLWNRADHYIFILWFLSIYLLLFSSPNLSGRTLDVYNTSTHVVALVRI